MAEEIVLTEDQKIETPQPTFSDNLRSTFFEEKVADSIKEEIKLEEKKEEPKTEVSSEPKEWLKKELDVDDVSVLKAEREELKTLRDKSKQYQFDESQLKTLDYLKPENEEKLLDFLNTKKKIDKLTSTEINEQNAADIIKFQMQQKYSTLSSEDIDYKFNRQYGIPKEPKEPQEDKFLTTDDYDTAKEKYLEDKQDWEQAVKQAKNELLIDAKLAVPEIQKLKSELNLPDIQRNVQSKEPTQEDLAAMKKDVDSFLQNAENFNKDFTGFNVPVKDKDVDYSVGYSISPEEKQEVMGKLKTFAESGFDANALLADRWVSEDGKSIKTDVMIKDLSRLFGGDKIDQKIALDSGNKRIEAYLKEKKQINLKETDVQQNSNLDKKSMSEKLAERFFN